MMFCVRSIIRWFNNNNLSHLLESINYWKFFSKTDEPLKKNETWYGLPDVAIKKIFGTLKVGDRARMKLVSKSWNQILNRVDIGTGLEAPWLINSDNDSCSNPETFLTQITIRDCLSENGRNYLFKLPKFYEGDDVPAGGCLCGTSNGWLVIAATAGPNIEPDMFLWNPLSGMTQKLPPLSTVPLVARVKPKLDDLPCFIKRVQVFTHEECCIVATVFSQPAVDDNEEDCLALCTPQEKRWRVMKRDYYNSYRYRDLLHHNGKLYALAHIIDADADDEEEEKKITKKNHTMYLSSRSNYIEVKVCVLGFKYVLTALRRGKYSEDEEFITRCFNIIYGHDICEHLVECSTTGKLLVVSAIFDLYKYNCNDDGPVESFMCHKTSVFKVRMVETPESVISSIGEQSLFISSMGSLSIPSSAQGLQHPDRIYFSTNDAQGFVGDEHRCIIASELGNFNMGENVANADVKYLKFPVQFKTGWFKPNLF